MKAAAVVLANLNQQTQNMLLGRGPNIKDKVPAKIKEFVSVNCSVDLLVPSISAVRK